MNFLPFKIASRYLVSKKSTNAINIITGVAMSGMAVGSLALILVLSVFNGFEGLVVSLYQTFNPDIQITAKEGKVFPADKHLLRQLEEVEGVTAVSKVLEENAILRYDDNEYIATLKGVDETFTEITDIEQKIVDGNFDLVQENVPRAVLGAGVAAALSVNIENVFKNITIFLPRRGKATLSLNPAQAFIRRSVAPTGVFSIQQEFDNKYLFVPLDYLRELLKYESEISGLEVKVDSAYNTQDTKARIQALLGDDFYVKDQYEQNEFLYKVMKTEKWAVFAILTLILIIAAFNIIGSLSMLVLEKTKDIAILKTMGATNSWIQRIFLLEGLLSSLIGSLAGILLAVVICWIQIEYGVIKLQGSGTFVIDAYPVKMKLMDFVLVGGTVVLISIAASWLPAKRAAKQPISLSQE